MGVPRISRRARYLCGLTVTLYFLFSVQWNTLKVNTHFYNSMHTLLPSTAQVDDLNLKNLEVVDPSSTSYDLLDLRVQLAREFPYVPSQPIPRKVWQTWKTNGDAPSFPSNFKSYQKKWIATCENRSPTYQYNLITDEQMLPLLKQVYGGVPQVVRAFESLPLPILKADFFRYLILFARGGIYSDMDTFPLKPLDTWPSTSKSFRAGLKNPIKYRDSIDGLDAFEPPEPGFVIGIEADPDRDDWADWYARRIQFCQWTMQAKPGHPLLRELISNITATTLHSVQKLKSSLPLNDADIVEEFEDDYNINMRDRRKFDKNYDHKQKKNAKNIDGTDIMNWTGPGIFSDIVFQYLNNIIQKNNNILIFNDNINDMDGKRKESKDETTMKFYKDISKNLQSQNPTFFWGFFSLMTKPALIDDVLVLPITSFSPDVGQMGSNSMDDEMALVKHLFEGSWKEEKSDNKEEKETSSDNDEKKE